MAAECGQLQKNREKSRLVMAKAWDKSRYIIVRKNIQTIVVKSHYDM